MAGQRVAEVAKVLQHSEAAGKQTLSCWHVGVKFSKGGMTDGVMPMCAGGWTGTVGV